MPSVRMRRSTRVFVHKTKGGEGVRVLRSGRRIWVESSEDELTVPAEGTDGEDLFYLIHDSDVYKRRKLDAVILEADEKSELQFLTGFSLPCVDQRFGIVYSRKRKRLDLKRKDSDFDRKFGLHFSRRQRRRIGGNGFLCLTGVDSSCGFAGVVSSVLRYMWTAKVGLVELSQSQLVDTVFASCGIHFRRSCPCNKRYGFCKIYGAREFVPLFDIDFMAVPLCFVHLHASLWFRSLRLSTLLLTNSDVQDEDDDSDIDVICISSKRHSFPSSSLGHVCSKVEVPRTLNTLFGVSRSTGWNCVATQACSSNGVATRSCSTNGVSTRACSRNGVATQTCNRSDGATYGCQKRRKRSPRTTARNPSLFFVHRGSESLGFDFSIRRSAVQSASASHNHEAQTLVRTDSSTGDMKLLKSSLLALGKDIDTVSCSANLLVVESDKCYRESGACVTLELSTSSEWLLAVRKDGSLRCYYRAEKGEEVKPSSTNCYNCAIVWSVEPRWKLEFTDRKDWTIFKELFKVCGDRNIVPSCATNAIPIPGICEVSVCHISPGAPYLRPESYIKMNDNELSRALSKRTVNYDMDSEDEEWVNTFNSGLEDEENDLAVRVTEESFELMMDAFEKAIFCNPVDFMDGRAPADLCLDLARRVVEAVYSYWTRKRKQKCASLLRVFQLNEPKIPFIPKPVLCKKRSMKQRHTAKATTPTGRGKQLSTLQAMAAELTAIEEKSVMLEVEEARGAARSALEVAVMQRRRAQTVMASADLAMYRAAMAVRIAEAAQAAEPDQAVAHFLDLEKEAN